MNYTTKARWRNNTTDNRHAASRCVQRLCPFAAGSPRFASARGPGRAARSPYHPTTRRVLVFTSEQFLWDLDTRGVSLFGKDRWGTRLLGPWDRWGTERGIQEQNVALGVIAPRLSLNACQMAKWPFPCGPSAPSRCCHRLARCGHHQRPRSFPSSAPTGHGPMDGRPDGRPRQLAGRGHGGRLDGRTSRCPVRGGRQSPGARRARQSGQLRRWAIPTDARRGRQLRRRRLTVQRDRR